MSSSAPSQQDLKQKGNSHFQNEEFEKAIEFYTQAINLDPAGDPTVPILSNRSLCYYNIKKYKEAYEDAGCCCGLKPNWAKGFARRGFAAMKLEEYEIALESFDEYLKLNGGKDEMDVVPQLNYVKKLLQAREKTQKENVSKLRKLDQELKRMSSDQRCTKACILFSDSAREFPLNQDRMRMAATHCRLDTPVDSHLYELHSPHNESYIPFAKEAVERCRADLDDLASLQDEYAPCSSLLHMSLYSALFTLIENRKPSLAVEFIDFLADLADAEEDYSPLLAEGPDDSELEMQKRKILINNNIEHIIGFAAFVSTEDPTSSSLLDIMITLLNRGKKFIFGEKTKMTDKEYATRLFRVFVTFAAEYDSRIVVEACLTLLEAKADVNGIIPHSGLPQLNTVTKTARSGSVKLVELVLRHGADAHTIGKSRYSNSTHHSTTLDDALMAGHIDICRLLFSRGVRFSTAEIPLWAREKLEKQENDAFSKLMKPKQAPVVLQFFPRDLSTYWPLGELPDHQLEELIRFIFDVIVDQDLSWYCIDIDESWESRGDNRKHCFTILSRTLATAMPSRVVNVVIGLKPALIGAPQLTRLEVKGTLKVFASVDPLVLLAERTRNGLRAQTEVSTFRKPRAINFVEDFKRIAECLITSTDSVDLYQYLSPAEPRGATRYPFQDNGGSLTDTEYELRNWCRQLLMAKRELRK